MLAYLIKNPRRVISRGELLSVRAELLRRIGLTDVLTRRDLTGQSKSAA
jgi:hypothetical protein